MKRVRHSRAAVAGVALLVLNALLFGALTVLAPLRLDNFGWSAAEIAAVFLVSSVVMVFTTPLIGNWSDVRGRRPPIIAGLAASTLVSAGLAVVGWSLAFTLITVVAGVAYSSAGDQGQPCYPMASSRWGSGSRLGSCSSISPGLQGFSPALWLGDGSGSGLVTPADSIVLSGAPAGLGYWSLPWATDFRSEPEADRPKFPLSYYRDGAVWDCGFPQ